MQAIDLFLVGFPMLLQLWSVKVVESMLIPRHLLPHLGTENVRLLSSSVRDFHYCSEHIPGRPELTSRGIILHLADG